MILRVGTDIEDVKRFRAVSLTDEFYPLVFRQSEIAAGMRSADPYQYFASRFAAKEAVIKAIGGFGIVLVHSDIEVLRSRFGGVDVRIFGERGRYSLDISLSHTQSSAYAVAIASKK